MADVRKLRDENDVLNERVGEQQQELDRFSSLKKKLELQSELKDLLKVFVSCLHGLTTVEC